MEADPIRPLLAVLDADPTLGIERLTVQQRDRITAAIDAHDAHVEVLVAWLATLEPRSAFRGPP